MNKYKEEAKDRWGETGAYKECEEKTSNQSTDEQKRHGEEMMMIFVKIGKIKHLSPACAEVQALVKKLQQFITDNYYNCTAEILRNLGQMYIADERFKNNIDTYGGQGTAEFASKAIEISCNN